LNFSTVKSVRALIVLKELQISRLNIKAETVGTRAASQKDAAHAPYCNIEKMRQKTLTMKLFGNSIYIKALTTVVNSFETLVLLSLIRLINGN
jgi:hypothetical protein